MSEKDDRDAVMRGSEAQQVLDNPAFRYAIDAMKTEIIATWKAAPIRDAEGQRLLLQLAKLCDKFEATLIGMVEGGKLADSRIPVDDLRNDSATRRLFRKVL